VLQESEYNLLIAHSDRLYIRCTFCKQFVLLARTNPGTRKFWDSEEVETFVKQHLKCNPFHVMENLCGVPGMEIIAWSDAGQEDEGTFDETMKKLSDDIKKDMDDIFRFGIL